MLLLLLDRSIDLLFHKGKDKEGGRTNIVNKEKLRR